MLDVTPNDNVFVFFSDHGAPGLIAFPSKYLYADQMLTSLNKITGKFNKFVFYLEVIVNRFRHANLAQCSKSSPPTLGSMPYLLPTQLSHLGEHTATPTMWFKVNILVLALETFSVSTLLRILIKETPTTKPYKNNSKSSRRRQL